MVITILALLFLLVIVTVAIVGYRFIIQAKTVPEERNNEKCTLCRRKFDKSLLIERQIGDYKLLFFCRECVVKLYADLGLKN
jgi:hypothetical protein